MSLNPLKAIESDLKSYLLCPDNLSIHKFENNQQFWPRQPDYLEVLHYDVAPQSTTLKVQRDFDTGEILEFQEYPIEGVGTNARNSMSFQRAPAPPGEAVRGSASYIPFQPGSFPEPELDRSKLKLLQEHGLLTIPPGFSRGLNFADDNKTVIPDKGATNEVVRPKTIDLLKLIQQDDDILSGISIPMQTPQKQLEETPLKQEEEELFREIPTLDITTPLPPDGPLKGTKWAILLDPNKPVTEFEKIVPNLAKTFPFELDDFQKLAIMQLEQHNHVFVAAHTSAGKTVVAEYAIALSQKHMTKTIYTSPIKALSNQKYRDFKKEFDDVGLITGEFQINQKASCLIMTTEILRSMLYCGSEITRDIEYVIFDEVHYVNDRDRGYVWEQVFIMLPKDVCMVLLSATVPNTIEFADWLGRTHQRPVYVITTTKRPVPLQHFLYTGRWGGSRSNRYMIMDGDQWRADGYIAAENAMEANPRQCVKMNSQQEATLWTSLVGYLEKSELLPVVAFVFSRQKCDQNANNLESLNLTTQTEKGVIEGFFRKCLHTLKPPDREIPQIVKMRDILQRGIGIHHSGVLPIVKEIVEMLFQQGLIKVLFATETFAMGVNMPTRTVIFDSVEKHDGIERRSLLPAEYIQMAGRAGRRGKDDRGTVLILCKFKVPPEHLLKSMMTGKPDRLVSQFRLTYGMVLVLLRVENLKVELMISKSFGEVDHQKKIADLERELKTTEDAIQKLSQEQLSGYLRPLVKFFECASAYLRQHSELMPQVVIQQKVVKLLNPCGVIVIFHENYLKIALILSRKTTNFNVLVLDDQEPKRQFNELRLKMLAICQSTYYIPTSKSGHSVIKIQPHDIYEISSKVLKFDTKLIENDWDKRQQERFRYDAPGQTCCAAVQQLLKLSEEANRAPASLDLQHLIKDLKVNDPKLFEELEGMYRLKELLHDQIPSTRIPNFEQQFEAVFERKFLEEKKGQLEYSLSHKSLTLYPDYARRIELLRELGYIDATNTVKLKGTVACEMGMNELLITELVVDDILINLQPSEVAALLSSLVFRVKQKKDNDESNNNEKNLTPNLIEGIRAIQAVHDKIANLERTYCIHTDEFQDDLNFGLVHVVYRWANSEPFAQIMELTEIQEGIIVRCIQQLNETIMDVRDAARIIGNPALKAKMEEASASIKRDIVFAESLYTADRRY